MKTENTGHKVLLFGKNLFSGVEQRIKKHDHALIDTISFPDNYKDLKRLKNYTLIVLDYAAFYINTSLYAKEQNIFFKLMIEALDSGSTFCFVHYNENVPKYDQYSHITDNMDKESINELVELQLGFRLLNMFNIHPYNSIRPIVTAKVKKGIFCPFLDKWGASHNTFTTYGQKEVDDIIDDIICEIKGAIVGFTINVRKGRIIYLPYQRDYGREEDLIDSLHSLIDCLLTYITKISQELPDWAKAPYFEDEGLIISECNELEAQLVEKKDKLTPFSEAKNILCQGEYDLEKSVPEFINKHFEINIQRNDNYNEDFWLLDEAGEKIAIAEVKSYVKGFKKSGIFSLFNHRETNQLDESFPAILFTNNFLQAGSWEKKDRTIDKQDYEVAAQNNILIIRIEDLVRLWDGKRQEVLTKDIIFEKLINSNGWLHIESDFQVNQMGNTRNQVLTATNKDSKEEQTE